MKFAFVILHYCAVETTIKSINSIIREIQGEDYDIVVVDNASPDNSGFVLEQKYKCFSCFHLIKNEENEGFAKGNNIGYRYAREVLKADFIIVMNNDVILTQPDFCQRISDVYRKTKFHILGPDIIGIDGRHQNPHRLETFGIADLNRIIVNRTIILLYLKLKKVLNLSEKIQILEEWDDKRSLRERECVDENAEQSNVVLHGSCLVFSPGFLGHEEEAFYKETFMWMEEEILTYICQKKGYHILYSPVLKVKHLEGISTNVVNDSNEKYTFYSQQLRRSAVVMRKLMKENSRGI